MVAATTFGFWTKLTERDRASLFWNPMLSRAFAGGPSCAQIHELVSRINKFCNRLATTNPCSRRAQACMTPPGRRRSTLQPGLPHDCHGCPGDLNGAGDHRKLERRRSNEELAEATQLVALADQVDEHAAERDQAVHARADRILQEAAGVYDSAGRRDQLAASFDGVADDEEVQARLIDDVGNALPPSAAVTRSRHPKARRSRGASTPSRDLEQGR